MDERREVRANALRIAPGFRVRTDLKRRPLPRKARHRSGLFRIGWWNQSWLAKANPKTALELVDLMKREVDKAAALRIIAAATRDRSLFEQAQGMALAARVNGDALAPSMSLFKLAEAFWTINRTEAESVLRLAYEAVLRIAVK